MMIGLMAIIHNIVYFDLDSIVGGIVFSIFLLIVCTLLWVPALLIYRTCKKGFDCYSLTDLFKDSVAALVSAVVIWIFTMF